MFIYYIKLLLILRLSRRKFLRTPYCYSEILVFLSFAKYINYIEIIEKSKNPLKLEIQFLVAEAMKVAECNMMNSGSVSRGCGSGFPSEDAGYVEADRSTGNGCWLVSFTPGFRLLAIGC